MIQDDRQRLIQMLKIKFGAKNDSELMDILQTVYPLILDGQVTVDTVPDCDLVRALNSEAGK